MTAPHVIPTCPIAVDKLYFVRIQTENPEHRRTIHGGRFAPLRCTRGAGKAKPPHLNSVRKLWLAQGHPRNVEGDMDADKADNIPNKTKGERVPDGSPSLG